MTKTRVRPPSQTYNHIIAERERRELLSQRFVILSGLVPGLKKMDKTSVLGEAIKYMKHLQKRVKKFEEKSTKQTLESAVLVRKSQVSTMGSDYESSDEEQQLPEIEAKVCKNQIHIRIHCEKQKGVMIKVLGEVEKLDNLFVIHSNMASLGNLSLNINIIAEMDKESNLTAKDIVKALRSALNGVA